MYPSPNPSLYLHSLLGKGVEEELLGIDSRCPLPQEQSWEK